MSNSASIHIDAATAEPGYHCAHAGESAGRISIKLSEPFEPVAVYVTGTPDEIVALGDAIWRIAVNARLDKTMVPDGGEAGWHRAFPEH